MAAGYDLSGVTCYPSCTKPCSSYREFVLSPSHTVRVYRHATDFWTTYVFTPCDGAFWEPSCGTGRHFNLRSDNANLPLLQIDLVNVIFDFTLRKNGRGLQLLIDGDHIFWSQNHPNKGKELRFEATHDPCTLRTLPDQPDPYVAPPLKRHNDNIIMGLLSLLLLFHLFNTYEKHTKDLFKYYDTVCMTTIQCCASLILQWTYSLVFPRSSTFYEILLDVLTLTFLVANGMAAYIASLFAYQDWMVMTLQQVTFWIGVKTCVERVLIVCRE